MTDQEAGPQSSQNGGVGGPSVSPVLPKAAGRRGKGGETGVLMSTSSVQMVVGQDTRSILLAPEGMSGSSVKITAVGLPQNPVTAVVIDGFKMSSADEIVIAVGRGLAQPGDKFHVFRYLRGQVVFEQHGSGLDEKRILPTTLNWVQLFAQEIPLYKIAFCAPDEWSDGLAKEQAQIAPGVYRSEPLIVAPRWSQAQDASVRAVLYNQDDLAWFVPRRRWRVEVSLGWRQTTLSWITVLVFRPKEEVVLSLETPAGLHSIRYQNGVASFRRVLLNGEKQIFGITGCWVKEDDKIRTQHICFTNEIAVR